MAKAYVLDRVTADLARGYTHPAVQRLGSLVAAHPTDLDLRHRLAMVHRLVGNRIQAGRWDYLTAGASSSDTSSFERAFPSALARLREVRWPHLTSAAATEYARARLAALLTAAAAERETAAAARRTRPARRPEARRPIHDWIRLWSQRASRLRSWVFGRPWRTVPIAVAAVATASFVVVGAATVLQWIIQ